VGVLVRLVVWAFLVLACTPFEPGTGRVQVGRNCEGVPQPKCGEMLADAERSAGGSDARIVGILIRCTRPPCTNAAGEGETIVAFTDGTEVSSGWVFRMAGAPEPDPSLAVVPVCLGVPRQQCISMITNMFMEPEARQVVSIVVGCNDARCTPEHGSGRTIVTFADGSSETSEWEYNGPGGPMP
jgi:hypothetical protein